MGLAGGNGHLRVNAKLRRQLTHKDELIKLLYMTKRLQVLLEDDEYRELKQTAARERMTVAEWVRQALRVARRQRLHGMQSKLDGVREAASHDYPTGDIEDMLAEIDRGRGIR